jgi:hypothetical protein
VFVKSDVPSPAVTQPAAAAGDAEVPSVTPVSATSTTTPGSSSGPGASTAPASGLFIGFP